jgi:hypothetical protein
MDFEAELISDLSELIKEMRENNSLKEEYIKLKEGSKKFK